MTAAGSLGRRGTASAAEIRGDLLHPVEGRPSGPAQSDRVMVLGERTCMSRCSRKPREHFLHAGIKPFLIRGTRVSLGQERKVIDVQGHELRAAPSTGDPCSV